MVNVAFRAAILLEMELEEMQPFEVVLDAVALQLGAVVAPWPTINGG